MKKTLVTILSAWSLVTGYQSRGFTITNINIGADSNSVAWAKVNANNGNFVAWLNTEDRTNGYFLTQLSNVLAGTGGTASPSLFPSNTWNLAAITNALAPGAFAIVNSNGVALVAVSVTNGMTAITQLAVSAATLPTNSIPTNSTLPTNWFTFNGSTKDSMSNAFVTVYGTPAYTNGQNGSVSNAVWLNGSSGVGLGTNTYGSNFSACAWIYPTAAPAYARFIEADYATEFYIGSDGYGTHFQFIVNNPSLGTCTGGSLTNNLWTFVAATFDGTTGTLFVNGAAVATNTFTAPTAWAFEPRIGMVSGAHGGNDFIGRMDDVRIYRRLLSPAEVSALWLGGAQ